ncbi:hypothetical protein BJ875DRAFT_449000 [Amylocarpus encephaloides]|uniref:Uncharacterized protein n=1 Tax=Amylocarpus encephaloides TaxID=45428 RepID=A0A9P8CA38_9HELO|nr:hypothetical protein BJ875DRAFT_449000 [Amylocarpus encephaloides]
MTSIDISTPTLGEYIDDPELTDTDESTDEEKSLSRRRFWTIVAVLFFVTRIFFWRWILGNYTYNVEYIKAVLGDDGVPGACAGVKTVENPWRLLHSEDWIQLQGCLGNEHGFERQGQLHMVVVDVIAYLWGLASLLGPLPTIGGIGFSIWLMINHGFAQAERLVGFIRTLSAESLAGFASALIALAVATIFLFFPIRVFVYIIALIAVICSTLIALSIHTGGRSRVLDDLGVFFNPLLRNMSWLLSFMPHIRTLATISTHVMTSAINYNTCHHIADCTCAVTDLENRNQAYQAEIKAMKSQLHISSAKAAIIRNHVTNPSDKEWWEETPPKPSTSSSNSREDNRQLAAVRKELTDLSIDKKTQEKKLEVVIGNLRAQLNYAQRNDTTLMLDEVHSLKAQLRVKTQEFNKIQLDLMQVQQALHYKQETQSKVCKYEAVCSVRIRTLEGEKQLLLDRHMENDLMVQQAAREFGKSAEEAKHYTLRMYLQEITQAMIQQIAAGGLGNIKNQPAFQTRLKHMDKLRIREMEAYKNRLEYEVTRLGGDVQIMRLGLDPRRPMPVQELTYDNHAQVVFPVYRALCGIVRDLSGIFSKANIPIPAWEHAPPRSIVSNARICLSPSFDLETGLPIRAKNPKYEQYEMLWQSLICEELIRLLGRAIDLKKQGQRIEERAKLDGAFYANEISGPLQLASLTIHQATEVLDDIRPIDIVGTLIEHSATAAKHRRRFRIWRAMQEAIEWLVLACEIFNARVPDWTIPKDKPLPDFSPTNSFEDLVVRLVKMEINTVEHRMMQLVDFMERERLPGTSQGQPRIQGSLTYQADWDALQAASTYTLLCRDHWRDEHSPRVDKKPRLPLDHPPLLHALRRQKGDVVVPLANPFPWRMTSDGNAQEARIVEYVDDQDPDNPQIHKTVVYDDRGVEIKYKLPVIVDESMPQTDSAGNPIMGDYEMELKWHERHLARIEQLQNWISRSAVANIGDYHFKSYGSAKGRNPTMGLLKAKKMELHEAKNVLTLHMSSNGLSVPQWPHANGSMWPGPDQEGFQQPNVGGGGDPLPNPPSRPSSAWEEKKVAQLNYQENLQSKIAENSYPQRDPVLGSNVVEPDPMYYHSEMPLSDPGNYQQDYTLNERPSSPDPGSGCRGRGRQSDPSAQGGGRGRGRDYDDQHGGRGQGYQGGGNENQRPRGGRGQGNYQGRGGGENSRQRGRGRGQGRHRGGGNDRQHQRGGGKGRGQGNHQGGGRNENQPQGGGGGQDDHQGGVVRYARHEGGGEAYRGGGRGNNDDMVL